MHRDHAIFIAALADQARVRLTFFSKEDGHELVRTCAPMDYGPSRRANDRSDRYHFWDYDSDQARHTLSLLANQIRSIERLAEDFDPTEFVTWSPIEWFVPRDWGVYS
ncbi:MAG TPA: hypothetical protein VGH79_05315 [Gaiellaceae bacterium]|jgi:hypothetical protein